MKKVVGMLCLVLIGDELTAGIVTKIFTFKKDDQEIIEYNVTVFHDNGQVAGLTRIKEGDGPRQVQFPVYATEKIGVDSESNTEKDLQEFILRGGEAIQNIEEKIAAISTKVDSLESNNVSTEQLNDSMASIREDLKQALGELKEKITALTPSEVK